MTVQPVQSDMNSHQTVPAMANPSAKQSALGNPRELIIQMHSQTLELADGVESAAADMAIQLAIRATFPAVEYAEDARQLRRRDIKEKQRLAAATDSVYRAYQKIDARVSDLIHEIYQWARNVGTRQDDVYEETRQSSMKFENAIRGFPKKLERLNNMAQVSAVKAPESLLQACQYNAAREEPRLAAERAARVLRAVRRLAEPTQAGDALIALPNLIALAQDALEDATALTDYLTARAEVMKESLTNDELKAECSAAGYDGFANAVEYTALTAMIRTNKKKISVETRAYVELADCAEAVSKVLQNIATFDVKAKAAYSQLEVQAQAAANTQATANVSSQAQP